MRRFIIVLLKKLLIFIGNSQYNDKKPLEYKKIFTRKEIAAMTVDEFVANEKIIFAQLAKGEIK